MPHTIPLPIPRSKAAQDGAGAVSDRKGKSSKQKHKVSKGPSLENLVYTPFREQFSSHFDAQSPLTIKGNEPKRWPNHVEKSKAVNTRKVQSITNLNEDILDLDTEMVPE